MTADLIIENAAIRTMNPSAPRASTIAIKGDKILAVGDDPSDFRGQGARVIDAGGATVTPGIVESHLHLFSGSYDRRLLQLSKISGADALAKALRAYAAANPDEGLLLAKGAGYGILGEGVTLTRQALDRMVPDRPVLIIAADYHTGWANTVALERAGILNGRALPAGNEIVMGADGKAAGELREFEAKKPVFALRTSGGRENLGLEGVEPEALTTAERIADREVITDGLRYLASLGITSLHNMDGNRYQFELLSEIEAAGDLLCRTQIPFHLTPRKTIQDIEEASVFTQEFATERLRCGRVKMFVDGVIESGTAVLLDDYADQPGWRGEPLHSHEFFNEAAIEIDRRGLQISVHAIGDAAVRMVLDGYAAARRANGPRDSRHRIEHIEIIHPSDIGRFAEMGVVASMQPPHPPGPSGWPLEPFASRIGPARWPYAFVWRDLWDAGARICFASDWPVSPVEPFLGVEAAMTRLVWDASQRDQSATLDEALASYTREGAYAGFSEHEIGMLKPGMQADLVMLTDDLETVAPDEIADVSAALTLCGGEVTWEA